MSRRIAQIVNEPEAAVTKLLSELEEHNGYPSHDARYIAASHQTLRRKLNDLRMDPDDTKAEELFEALRIKLAADAERLERYFNVYGAGFDQKADQVAELVTANLKMPSTWVLKSAAAKKLLRELPPKKVMKNLGFRSIESMLKREKTSKILIMSEVLESDSWHKNLHRLASRLDQTSFEARPLEITALDQLSDQPILISELCGTIAMASDEPLLVMLLQIAEILKNYGSEPGDIYKLNWIIGWWADTDNLVAALEDGQVSLNLHDVAASWLFGHSFEYRQIHHSRRSYWHNLMEKYENKALLEETFDDSVMSRVRKLNFKGPQPAFEFEYAEDL